MWSHRCPTTIESDYKATFGANVNLTSLQWYASRLAAMSWGERIHRIREAFLRKTVQLDTGIVISSTNQLFLAPDLEKFLDHVDEQFCATSPSGPGDVVHIYGQLWPLDSNGIPHWHQLLNGIDTASTPTFKVHYRNSEDLKDDVRINWELNRLTWLIPTAVHAKRTNNQESQQYALEVLRSFLDSDRVGYSSRWSSSIELAMQSLSLVIVGSLLDVATINSEMHTRLSGAILKRYEWIERFPSKYSSANNHLLAELAALAVISAVIPDLQTIHDKKMREFIDTANNQFNGDGLNAELATDYHLYALDLLLSVLYLSNNSHNASLTELIQTVSQATQNIIKFCGFWPRISDSDHAAVMSNAAPEQDRAQWLTKFSELLLHISLDNPGGSPLTFRDSGYTFLKSVSGSGEVILLTDHGYLGFGDIAAHAHADSAAIWMWVNGEPVLIESGTYSYHSRDDLRDAFRSSMWHNTISINGASTSTSDGPFLWLKKKRASARLLTATQNSVEIEVTIPKSPSLESEARHIRHITLVGSTIEVTDTVCATIPFELSSHLVLAEEFKQVSQSGLGEIYFTKTPDGEIKITYDSSMMDQIVDEIETSSTYGKLEQNKRITFTSKNKAKKHVLAYSFSYHLIEH